MNHLSLKKSNRSLIFSEFFSHVHNVLFNSFAFNIAIDIFQQLNFDYFGILLLILELHCFCFGLTTLFPRIKHSNFGLFDLSVSFFVVHLHTFRLGLLVFCLILFRSLY